MAEIQDKTSTNPFQIDTDDSPIGAVIDFLDTHLQNFPADFTKRTLDPSKVPENLISQELEIFLNRRSTDEVFKFKGQWVYSDSNRQPDFGVITVEDNNPFGFTNVFFEIEAKRLPTGYGREKEYVEGNLGGIQRFKEGHHGKDLSQSAMVGYVQKETCLHWHTEINKWIANLINANSEGHIVWNETDLLRHLSDFNKIQKYVSENQRDIDSIRLYHYLMDLN